MDREKVYETVRKIPPGCVGTYGTVARAAGFPGRARWVGWALGKNRKLVETPCHRVVRSDGRVGGYALGKGKKAALLEMEGVKIRAGKIDLRRFLFGFE